MVSMHSSSESRVKWETPERVAWVSAPPRASCVISSPVTALMTSGPVMNIWEMPRTMRVKSVMAGE